MYTRNIEKWGVNCALLGYYAGSSGNFHHHYSLCKNPKEPSSQLLCGGSLKSRKWGGGLPTDLAQLHVKTLRHNNAALVGKGAWWTAVVKIKGDEGQISVCANREVKRRREGIVPLILNIGTRWWWSASHPGHLTPRQSLDKRESWVLLAPQK
jgi:hypothetical protein